jgi:signal transduction histidine kinase
MRCWSVAHVRGDEAVLHAQALDEVDLDPGQRRLLDRDDALLADAVECLGDRLADPRVLLGGDRRDVAQVVAADDRARAVAERLDDALGRLLDPAPQQHRVGALVDRAHTLAHDRLSQQRRRRRAVAGEVARLVGDVAHELRTHVLERVGELDLARDRDSVVGDRRRSGQALQHHVAALRPERHLDGVGELVDARLQPPAGVVVEVQDLARVVS